MKLTEILKKSATVILTVLFVLSSGVPALPVYAEKGNSTVPQAQAPEDAQYPDLALTCKSAVLMEVSTGQILYAKNMEEALPPASVTKIMTLLLVMEAIDDGHLNYTDMVTASAHAASMGGSQIFLKEGESMTVEDLLKSVVICSANDAAVALAERVSGSEASFVAAMNQRASELGMKNTHFENTNGLDDTVTNHVTSAYDIALMSRALLSHRKILEYSSIWMDTIRNGSFGLTNTNRLVRFYPGATGLKTGSTAKAKFCISATACRDGMDLICVIMAADTRDIRNQEAKLLLDYGYANYELYRCGHASTGSVTVFGGEKSQCETEHGDFSVVVKKGEGKRIQARVDLPENVSAPLHQGQVVGRVCFTLDKEPIGQTDIFCTENVEKIGFWTLFTGMLRHFLFC